MNHDSYEAPFQQKVSYKESNDALQPWHHIHNIFPKDMTIIILYAYELKKEKVESLMQLNLFVGMRK